MEMVIKAALEYHIVLMAEHHKKSKIAGNVALEEARATNAMLRRLKTSSLFDD
jgi:hypothetical protein